jgi:hypothetical protein
MEAVSTAAKETGEAIAAVIDAVGRSKDHATVARAVAETEEGIGALQALRHKLKRSG